MQNAQQVLFTCHKYFLLESLAPQGRVVGQGQLQRGLERHKHDDEVNHVTTILDILGIVLTCQFIHMLAHTLDMILQIALLVLW